MSLFYVCSFIFVFACFFIYLFVLFSRAITHPPLPLRAFKFGL